MFYLAAAVAIAVAVLLVAVFVLPSFGGSGSNSGNANPALTYAGARPVADRTASGFAGGGWTLLVAFGLVSATTVPAPANTTAFGNLTGCMLTPETNFTGLSLPAFSGNRSAGTAPAWEFGYRNSSNTLAIVSVINGEGLVLATLTGTECSFFVGALSPVPSDVINSSAAAAAVEPEASAFLSAHPNASAEFALIGGISLLGRGIGPEWSILYNTCALGPTATGTGEGFNATVNALSGKVLGFNTTLNESCSGSTTPTEVGVTGPVATSPYGAVAARTGRSD